MMAGLEDSPMTLRRAWLVAACMIAAVPAAAQFNTFAPPQQQQEPPCLKEFTKLRNDTEGKAKAIRAANDRHADTKEACGLFNAFFASEGKMLKYAEANATWCGIPPQVIESIKKSHAQAGELRSRVCQAAANAQRAVPRAPTLSDALSEPIPDSNNIKTGHGTFDTLTGTPLGK
jgi:hypothetical protein